MTVYGDLDTTVLDELPPGRTPVGTVWARGPLDVEAAWQTVREEIAKGHQAYVVCPLVEESERVQAASASEELARLASGPLAGLRLGSASWATAVPGKGGRHGAVPRRRAAGAGGDDRHRGGRRRPQRDGHGGRGRRPFRHRAAPPAARAGRPGGGKIVVLPAQ